MELNASIIEFDIRPYIYLYHLKFHDKKVDMTTNYRGFVYKLILYDLIKLNGVKQGKITRLLEAF